MTESARALGPRLSPRLSQALAFLGPTDVVCDIGADHGALILAFAARARDRLVFATELAAGPWARLEDNVAASPYAERVEVYQADGLYGLPTAVDTLVICGMGGESIARIIANGRAELPRILKIVAEPQGHAYEARAALLAAGFAITDEVYVAEKNRAYPVIKAQRGATDRPYGEWELEFGRLPIAKKDPLLGEYLKRTIAVLAPLAAQKKASPRSLVTLTAAETALGLIESEAAG